MRPERILPVLRDAVFLGGGTFTFVTEALGQARWEPMLLGMLFAAGPAAVTAFWGRTPGNGSQGSSRPASSSPVSSSSPPPAGGDR